MDRERLVGRWFVRCDDYAFDRGMKKYWERWLVQRRFQLPTMSPPKKKILILPNQAQDLPPP